MRARRNGFTLIELLIVIVIIGILAAIALPKLGRTREKAYFKSMQTDLRNMLTQQEIYHDLPANNGTYAANLTDLGITLSAGVTASLMGVGNTGWGATAGHAALASDQICALFFGTLGSPPAPATLPGVIACTND